MMKNKLIYLLCVIFCCSSCSKDEPVRDEEYTGEIKVHAALNEKTSTTRSTSDAPVGDYFLFLPTGSFNTTQQVAHAYGCETAGTLLAKTPLHWDDIEPADPQTETTFYLTNVEETVFADGTDADILWGMDQAWNNDRLDFTLTRSMSKLTFVLKDETINKNVDFTNARVILRQGLFRKAHELDITTGVVSMDGNATREEATTIASPTIEIIENAGNIATLHLGIIPPQSFANDTEVEIITKEYVYRIPLPTKMFVEAVEKDIALNAGEHLVITVTLTEHTINFEATLAGWNDVPTQPIDVNRVFNISNWDELKDLMLAVNTGYTFKGMVVRLTKNIVIEDQLSLGNEKYPFEGIFDGNGKTITKLGHYGSGGSDNYNRGGLFGYVKEATLQNITLIDPFVKTGSMKALGALADKVEDTTIFNCLIKRESDADPGVVTGTSSYTGGLVGHAIGSTTFTNCYTIVSVRSTGDEYVGGLVGYSEGSVNHCSAQGMVDAASSGYVGGLVGYTTNTVTDCFAWGEVKGFSKSGGLIGHADGLVSYSYAEGNIDISSGTDHGGLLGSMGFYGDANYCFWKHSATYNGIGSATLNNTCESFPASSSSIVTKLNRGGAEEIWKALDNRAIFANQ